MNIINTVTPISSANESNSTSYVYNDYTKSSNQCVSNTFTYNNSVSLYDNYKNHVTDNCNSTELLISSKSSNKDNKIKDVEILVPNKVVKVTFEDDTFEKAICHPDDYFDINVAIGICLAKHLCGGSSKYNNIINKGVKLYVNKCKAEEEAKKEKERIEAKRKKKHEKLMKRIAKRETEARNARIQELAEAIRRADDMKHTEGI